MQKREVSVMTMKTRREVEAAGWRRLAAVGLILGSAAGAQ
jgi:hypothetical protein